MTITLPGSGTLTVATTTTAVFTTASTLGHTPATGNLVVLQLDRAADNAADTPPSGWSTATQIGSTATVGGHCGIYYRQIDGTESGTYTWSFASSSRKGVFTEFHDSVAGKNWVLDTQGVVTYQGSNTAGTSLAPMTTGTLTDPNEVAVASLVLAASTGTVSPTISGFTIPFGTNTPEIEGYAILSANTALNPTFSWTTSRAKSAGAMASFKSVSSAVADSGFLVMF